MRSVPAALAAVLILAGLGVLQAQERKAAAPAPSPVAASPIKLTTPFQVVALAGGQLFIGRLEGAGSAYPVLTDVYYIVTRPQGDGRPPVNNLVKRGNEWHAPDRMVINAAHLLFIEPVNSGSALDKLIQDEKAQRPPTADAPKADIPATKPVPR